MRVPILVTNGNLDNYTKKIEKEIMTSSSKKCQCNTLFLRSLQNINQ